MSTEATPSLSPTPARDDGPIVTLTVTLARTPVVTLALSARPRSEGDKVKEVEDPPFRPPHGDKAPPRAPRAYARALR
jgi:hypothetical protein